MKGMRILSCRDHTTVIGGCLDLGRDAGHTRIDVSLLHASCQPSNRVGMSVESSVVQLVLASVARAEQRAALVAAGGVPRARRGRRGGRSQQVQSIRIDPVEEFYSAPSRSRSRSRGCSSGTGGTLAPLSANNAGAPLPSARVVLLKAFPKARPLNVFLP